MLLLDLKKYSKNWDLAFNKSVRFVFLNRKNYILNPQDTISTLPEDVIHHIISFLETEDKEQLQLLSRKCRLIHSQTQKNICFSVCFSLDEKQLLTSIQDYFPSADYFVIKGML